jgi:hypothetical protein
MLSAPLYPILRFLDRFTAEKAMFDSSSGVYFLGKKGNAKIQHADVRMLYRGLQ